MEMHGALGAMVAYVAHQRTRVDAFDGHHAVLSQDTQARQSLLRQLLKAWCTCRAPPGRAVPARSDWASFAVHAVIAYLRVRHGDDLPGVARGR